jgi:hypothetical protein
MHSFSKDPFDGRGAVAARSADCFCTVFDNTVLWRLVFEFICMPQRDCYANVIIDPGATDRWR